MAHSKMLSFKIKIPTVDNWHPTDQDGTVTVSVHDDWDGKSKNYVIRLAVWGDDDFGLEKIWTYINRAESISAFRSQVQTVKKWKSVTISGLKAKGFQPA